MAHSLKKGKAMTLTQQEASFFVSYDPENGKFFCKKRRHKTGIIDGGYEIGGHKNGYIQIPVAGKLYRAHRIAWLLMTGEFPPKGKEIDHITGVRDDNRWCNLRLADRCQNNMNMGLSKANKSGVRGVSWCSEKNKWDVRIRANKKLILLGRFAVFEDAVKARQEAERQHHGEFVRQ